MRYGISVCDEGTAISRLDTNRTVTRAYPAHRREVVQQAIGTLLGRGIRKADLCRLPGVNWGSLLAWERGDRLPSPNVEERFAALLAMTAELPVVGVRRMPAAGDRGATSWSIARLV